MGVVVSKLELLAVSSANDDTPSPPSPRRSSRRVMLFVVVFNLDDVSVEVVVCTPSANSAVYGEEELLDGVVAAVVYSIVVSPRLQIRLNGDANEYDWDVGGGTSSSYPSLLPIGLA